MDIRNPLVYHSEKSIEDILFLLNGQPVRNAEKGIVSHWMFKPLVLDPENLSVYYLDPFQVKVLNKTLTTIDVSDIKRKYDPQKMKTNDIYPDIWDENRGYNGLIYLEDHFKALKNFISEAASNDQIVIAIPT